MNKKILAYSDVLFEPVKGLSRLKPADFEQTFIDDVADLDDVYAVEWRTIQGFGEIYILSNGFAVHVDRTGRMSLYETEAHHTQRTLLSEWATFVRGSWSDRTPTEPGVYFVRDKDLGRRSVREISRVNGRTVDVSGGNVPWGQISVWAGQWWSVAIPKLPGAY